MLRAAERDVVDVGADDDPRAVRRFVDDIRERFAQGELLGRAGEKVHALPKLLQGAARLQVCRRNLALGVLGIAIDDQLCRFRLHDDGRDRVPRRIVDVLCDALTLFQYRHFLQVLVCLLEFLAVLTEFRIRLPQAAVALFDLLERRAHLVVRAVDIQDEIEAEKMQRHQENIVKAVGDEHGDIDVLLLERARNGESDQKEHDARHPHRHAAHEAGLSEIKFGQNDDIQRRDEQAVRKNGQDDEAEDIQHIAGNPLRKLFQSPQLDCVFRGEKCRHGQQHPKRAHMPEKHGVPVVDEKQELHEHEQPEDDEGTPLEQEVQDLMQTISHGVSSLPRSR